MQDHPQSSQSSTGVDLSHFSAYDHAKQFASEIPSKSYSSLDGESRCYLFLVYINTCFHRNDLYCFPEDFIFKLLSINIILQKITLQDSGEPSS